MAKEGANNDMDLEEKWDMRLSAQKAARRTGFLAEKWKVFNEKFATLVTIF